MGRPEDRKHLAPYSILAHYYDALLGDEEGFKVWIKALKKYTKGHKVLDLASGSAVFARLMTIEGYEVLASDISQAMKEVAKKNFTGSYEILDMRNFDLDRKFDIITCVCDSVNYLDLIEFKSFLDSCYKALNKGYLFFDMHDLKRLEEFKEPYIEEGEVLDTPYIFTIEADEVNMELYEHFSFMNNSYELREDHHQFVYQIETIENLLKKAGFKVRVIKDFIKDEKVLMIGEKI